MITKLSYISIFCSVKSSLHFDWDSSYYVKHTSLFLSQPTTYKISDWTEAKFSSKEAISMSKKFKKCYLSSAGEKISHMRWLSCKLCCLDSAKSCLFFILDPDFIFHPWPWSLCLLFFTFWFGKNVFTFSSLTLIWLFILDPDFIFHPWSWSLSQEAASVQCCPVLVLSFHNRILISSSFNDFTCRIYIRISIFQYITPLLAVLFKV